MITSNTEFRNKQKLLEELTGKQTYFVYVLENKLNNRKYYGIAKDLLNRWESHRMDLVAGRHRNKNILYDYEKQGEINYKMSVLSICFDKEEALNIEKELIVEDCNCYNIMGTGKGKPRTYTTEQIEHALKLKESHSYKQVEEMTGISKSTLIRAKKEERC